MNNTNIKRDRIKGELIPGEIISGFEIIGELGRGANGIVYRARQIQLAREVALKILPAALATDKDFVEKFFREAQLAAKINYPSIVMAIDVGVSDSGIYFMAMELIDGETLEDLVTQNGPIEFHSALKMALDIAEGLDYAWRTQKLTHGDIKPANIIIDSSGKAKLADLGLAKIADENHIGDLMATPMFAAPEVCLFEFDKIGFKSDMYSYACTLFFMFTGEAPFEEEDSDKVMQMHVSERPPELIERLPFLPSNISAYIARMLAKKPEERPDQWSDVVDFLRQARTELIQNELPHKIRKPTSIFVWLGLFVLLSGAVGVVLWYLSKNIKADIHEPKIIFKSEEPSLEPQIDEPKPKLDFEEKKQETQQVLQLSIENRYREIVGNANFLTKSYPRLMEIERELIGLSDQLKFGSYPNELNISAVMEQLKVDLKLLPVLIGNKQADAERKLLQCAIDGFREKPPTWPDGTLSPQAKTVILYFRALTAVINQVPLQDSMMRRQSPENREHLQFLEKCLQQTSSPKEIILRHPQKLIKQRLPWSWQGSREWDIDGIELDKLNLTRTVTGGGMFRSRVAWETLKEHQVALLIEQLITQRGQNNLSNAERSALVGWLFSNQELEILNRVTASPGNISEPERLHWQRFNSEAQSISYEKNTELAWNKIRQLLHNKNYRQALHNLSDFTGSGLRGFLYSTLQPEAEQLIETLLWRYPEVQGQFAFRKVNQMNPNEVTAISVCGTTLARYYATRSGSEKNLLQDFMRNALKTKTVNLDKLSTLPQNHPLNPGEINQWIIRHHPKLNPDSTIMQSALLDIGEWERLAKNFKAGANLTIASQNPHEEFSGWHYSNLYDLGFIAWQYGDIDSARNTLTLMMKNLPEVPDQRNVVTARLAITMRDYPTVETMLRTLRIENQTFVAYQLMLGGLLIKIQNRNFGEHEFARAIDLLKIRFERLNLSADLRILDFVKDVYQGKTADISSNDFKQCKEPTLLGQLYCDILARNIFLDRNSAKTSTVDAIAVADSCYSADLWYRIALLRLLQKGPSIQEWRKSLKMELNDYSFAALPNYPQLLMLKCLFELLEGQITIEQAPSIYSRIIDNLPMTSVADRDFAVALREPSRFHDGGTYLAMLAAAVSDGLRSDGDFEKIFQNISKQHPELLWQELLLERDLKTMLKAIKIQKRPQQ